MMYSTDKLTDSRKIRNRGEHENIPSVYLPQIRLSKNDERRRNDVIAKWVLGPDGHFSRL